MKAGRKNTRTLKRDFWAKGRIPKIMITEFASGRGTGRRSEFLPEPHGNMGDVSVIVVSGAWQSWRLTSPPRGLSELSLLGGLLPAPKHARAANMTKSLETQLLSSAVRLLFLSFTLPLAPNPASARRRGTRKEHRGSALRKR